MPKISIITCTWNSEKYLGECLRSIISQTFDDFEIIIVDGGSTDKTLDIARSFNIDKIFTDITGGVSKAMNYGITHSSGEIISILHSDDYYYSENTLKIVVSCFENSNCSWIYGNLARIKDLKPIIFQKNKPFSSDYFSYTFNVPHPTVFVKKSVYDEVGLFDEKYKYAMDYDLLLRISQKYNPCQIEDFLTVFREHEDSLSSSNWSKAQIESLKVQQKHAKNVKIKVKGLYRFVRSRLAKLKNKFK